MFIKETHPGIDWYLDALDDPQDIVRLIENDPGAWIKPQNVSVNDRSNSVIYFLNRMHNPKIFDAVDTVSSIQLEIYRRKYNIPPLTYSSVEALKYEQGERYIEHFDNGAKHVAGRISSMVIYLNDDYIGGEIGFPLFDLLVKPPANSVVIFPSNYPYIHVVKPVISGTRYALNIFFEYP